ncbi:MAG: hypothetical protein JSU01_21870 [Bacteroidetes bacterium]|nr:hypothetical protein [Bacteroidota bacterium]
MMKCIVVLMAAAAIISVKTPCFAQQHHVLTKYGDDVGTLDGIIKAYYDVVSVKKGEKVIYERDSLLHITDVRVGSAGIDAKGNPVLHYTTLQQYHKESDAYMEKNGFYEHETARQVQNIRNIYHVWSSYEERNEPGGKIIGQGINSIELYYDGKRFWILGWFYD